MTTKQSKIQAKAQAKQVKQAQKRAVKAADRNPKAFVPMDVKKKIKNVAADSVALASLNVGDTFLFNDGKGVKPARVVHNVTNDDGVPTLVVYQYIGYTRLWATGDDRKAFRDDINSRMPLDSCMGVKLPKGRTPDTKVIKVIEVCVKVKVSADAKLA